MQAQQLTAGFGGKWYIFSSRGNGQCVQKGSKRDHIIWGQPNEDPWTFATKGAAKGRITKLKTKTPSN